MPRKKVLSQKRPAEKPKNWFVDTETYVVLDLESVAPDHQDASVGNPLYVKGEVLDSRVYAVGGLTEGFDYRSSFSHNALKAFVEDLSRQKGHINLWMHNASYDIPFIIREIVEGNHGFRFKAKFTEEQILIGAKFALGKDLTVNVGCTWFGDKSMSLADGTEAIGGTQKLTLDDYVKYNMDSDLNFKNRYLEDTKFNEELEHRYLRNDVQALPEVVEVIRQQQAKLGKFVGLALDKKYQASNTCIVSQPSAVKRIVGHALDIDFDEHFRPLVDMDTYLTMADGYIGGFVSGNKQIHKYSGKVHVYDINSFYPSIMAEQIPYGLPLPHKPKDKHIVGVVVKGTKCAGKEQYSFFDNELLGKSFKSLDGITPFAILQDTLKLADRLCDHDLRVVEKWYQPVCGNLSDYIRQTYLDRTEIKRQLKDLQSLNKRTESQEIEIIRLKQEEQAYKIILNSLYGKFAERYHSRYIEITHKNPVMTTKENESILRPSILAGSYVTGTARIKLIEAAIAEHEAGNTFLYCDTDSLFIAKNTDVSLPLDNVRLGFGKFEGEFNEFRYIGKHKKYALGNTETNQRKIAAGGVTLIDQIRQWPIELLEIAFNEENNIRFLDCKNRPRTRKNEDDPFQVPIIEKTHYDMNATSYDKATGKIKRRIPTHICRAPYTELEPYGEQK